MSATVGSLNLKITAGVGDLKSKLAEGQKHISSFAKKAEGGLTQVADVLTDEKGNFLKFLSGGVGSALEKIPVAGAAAALAVGAITHRFGEVMEKAHELENAASRLGTNVETVSVLKDISEDAGIGFEAMSKGISKFQEKLGDAASGGKEAADVFKGLGLNVADLTEMDLGKQLETVSKRLMEINSPGEKAYFMLKTMGKAGVELIPIMEKLSKGMELNTEETKKTKEFWTTGEIEGIMKAKRGLRELREEMEGTFEKVAARILDDFSAGMETASGDGFWNKIRGKLQQANAINPLTLIPGLDVNKQEREARRAAFEEEAAWKQHLAKANAKSIADSRQLVDLEEKLGKVLSEIGQNAAFDKHQAALAETNRMLELQTKRLKGEGKDIADVQSQAALLTEHWNQELVKQLGLLSDDATAVDKYRQSLANVAKLQDMNLFGDPKTAQKTFLTALGLGEVKGPFDKFRETMNQLVKASDQLVGGGGQDLLGGRLGELKGRAMDNLIKDLNLVAELDPFAKWLESFNQLERKISADGSKVSAVFGAGAVGDAFIRNLKPALGIAEATENSFVKWGTRLEHVQKLLAAERISATEFNDVVNGIAGELAKDTASMHQAGGPSPTAALLYGTSSEFSAVKAFQRREGADDPVKRLEVAMKQAADSAKKTAANTGKIADGLKTGVVILSKR